MADLTRVAIPVPIADLSTAQTQIITITEHNAGQLIRATNILGSTIDTADDKIVISKNGTALGTIVVAYTSCAAGDVDYLDFTNTFVKAGDYITIANGGESGSVAAGCVTIDIKR